jgi:hypothetical protein
MRTCYYRLKPPITSLRATVGGGHTQLGIWVNHAKAGDITLRNEEVKPFILALVRYEVAVKRRSVGDGKLRFEFFDDDVDGDTFLVSEYGDFGLFDNLGLTPEQRKEYRL